MPQILLCVSYLAVALLLCAPASLPPGWPENHEHLAPFERVECFRRAFVQGVWMPMWTPYPFSGLGSPFPLLYHRLFNTAGGLLAVAFGSVAAVKMLIPMLLLVGGFGTYRLCRVLATPRALSGIAGVLFMTAPYTLMEWLVRGAVAEFAAAMILPWWLATLVRFVDGQRRWVALAALTALLFHAHSVVCFYAMPLVAAALVGALVGRSLSMADLRREWRQVAAGLVVGSVCVLPFVLAMGRMIPFVNTEFFAGFTTVAEQFTPFERYLADDTFGWGTQFKGVSVELNRYVVVALLVFAFAGARIGRRLERRATRFLLGALAFFVYLQLPVSDWFYVHVPGAAYLQFPWRLNAFMTPIVIALLVVAAGTCAEASKRARLFTYGALALCLLLSSNFARRALKVDYERVSGSELTAKVEALSDDVAGVEYLPKGVSPPVPSGSQRKSRRQLAKIGFWNSKLVPPRPLVEGDCAQVWPTAFSGRSVELDVTLEKPCRSTIRQFRSPALALELQNAELLEGRPEDGYSLLLRPGRCRVSLRQKGLLRLAAEWFSKAA